MTRIETERLNIRNFTVDDWKGRKEITLQYEASEYAPYDHPWPTSDEDIKGIAQWFASGDNFLAVCLKTTGHLIGFISLNEKEEEQRKTFRLGYRFNFNYHGQGYATEGCQAILTYAFEQLDAACITSGTAAANHPSRTLLKRLGFEITGESTVSFREMPDGTPIEFRGLSFELTKDEWGAQR